jgi:hypothetical protein
VYRLAAFRVGNAHGRGHHHRGMCREARLDLVGIDIATVADDGVFNPVQ